MADVSLKTAKREATGKAVKAIRADGWVPGIMYGQGKEATAIQANERDLDKVYTRAGTSKLVDVTVGEEAAKSVLFYDVQHDPMTQKIRHFDLYTVKMDEEIHTEVPIHFVNESAAVIAQAGELMKNLEAVEIKALPGNLPEHLEVDLSKLENVGDSVSVADLDVPKGVEIQVEPDVLVVKIEELRETTEEDLAELEVDEDAAAAVESEHGAEETAEGEESEGKEDKDKGDKQEGGNAPAAEAGGDKPKGEDKKES